MIDRLRKAGNWGTGLGFGLATWLCSPMAGLAGAGQSRPGQMVLQDPVTPIAVEILWLYDIVNYIIIAITVFVMLLLLWVIIRYNEKSNPVPSRVTHNTTVEVLWTVIPVLILVAMAIPSFKLLYMQYDFPKPDLTIKATGYQWYWSHEYPDQGGVKIDSVMLQDNEREERIKRGIDSPRLLAVDNEVLVPVNKVVHVLVTASDVIHTWTIPSFGSKVDAVPGRVTSTWFKATKEGVYYGQCSELCGKDHAFMPIAVRVVKDQVFNDWIAAVKAKDRRKARDIIEKAELEQTATSRLAAK